MTYKNASYPVQAMTRCRSAMLGVLVLGFGGAGMTVACGSSGPGPDGSGGGPPSSCITSSEPPDDTPGECPAPVEEPCMRYRIPLVGNPSTDVALRNKYIAAFGDACYMSEANAFNCFYKKWQDACADAVEIAEVYGAAPYDKGYTCQPVAGTDDYTLQIGPDVANNITINYQAAPRQTPLVEVDGVPTEVSGPYRNLTEPPTLGAGQPFNKCDSGIVNGNGEALTQTQWILQVNRKRHGGAIHSDLAGFTWPCKNEQCEPVLCEEPLVLGDPEDKPLEYPDTEAQVHHVVPMTDKRSCAWGTNSNKNAEVISRKLNQFFTNNDPPAEEVKRLNGAEAYTPSCAIGLRLEVA